MPAACEWGTSVFLIFSTNVGPFIYYTHIFPLVISMFLGIQILLSNPKKTSNRVLFAMTAFFSLWVYFDLILWASPSPESVIFFWNTLVIAEMMMYLSAIYLIYLFTHNQQEPSFITKISYALMLLPILLFAHTSMSVVGLSPDCDEGVYEGIIIQYMYLMEIIIIVIGSFYVIKNFRNLRKHQLYISLSSILFLILFTIGNLTLIFDLGAVYEQFKLLAMPVFAFIVAIAIARWGTFSVKVIATDILLTSLWMAMFSTLLLQEINTARIVIAITLAVFSIFAINISRSVKNEIEQKQEIAEIAKSLEKSNKRLKELDLAKSEFVSIASHQLRSPLAAIRGYASLLRDGTYGEVSENGKEALVRIENSSKLMVNLIEDFLNISRIESGQLKYETADFNLNKLVETVANDLNPVALQKGLVIMFRDQSEESKVSADKTKVEQALHNLINNAIKYTARGRISIIVKNDEEKAWVEITDTGIGISENNMHKLFTKFTRGDNANSINTSGTGLGLYVARSLLVAMGGNISAHSDGEGKGSKFILELPLVK